MGIVDTTTGLVRTNPRCSSTEVVVGPPDPLNGGGTATASFDCPAQGEDTHHDPCNPSGVRLTLDTVGLDFSLEGDPGLNVRVLIRTEPHTAQIRQSGLTVLDAEPEEGDSYIVELLNPNHTEPGGGPYTFRRECELVSPAAGTVPQVYSHRIAEIECALVRESNPPEPPGGLPGETIAWNLGPRYTGCIYACDEVDPVPAVCPPANYPSHTNCFDVTAPPWCRTDCSNDSNLAASVAIGLTGDRPGIGRPTADSELRLDAEARDDDGVEGFLVYVNDELVHTAHTGGPAVAVLPTKILDVSGYAEGLHHLEVWALDNNQQILGARPVETYFEVEHPDQSDPCDSDASPPDLTIDGLPAGDPIAPGTYTVFGTAFDDDSGIRSVRFRVNGQQVRNDTSRPYTYTWHVGEGTHHLEVIATDHCGQATSRERTVEVVGACAGSPAPTVEITSHADGAWYDPATMTFAAAVTDGSGQGLSHVELTVGQHQPRTLTAPPWAGSYHMNTSGEHLVRFDAWDACGRHGSDVIRIHVSQDASLCELDQSNPLIAILSPADDATVPSGPFQMSVHAEDDVGLWVASLWQNGTPIPGSTVISGNPADYQWVWQATPGSHDLEARVMDRCEKIGLSPSHTVRVTP